MKNTLTKKFIALFIVMAVLISSLLLVVFSTGNVNGKNTLNSLNFIADTSNSEISNRSIDIGSGGDGSMANPYTDNSWNGRVKITGEYLKNGGGANFYIDLNVDPRDSIFGDDVIIEYKHYALTHLLGQRKSYKILYFEAKIQFFDGNANFLKSDVASKGSDSQASFTRNSNSKVVNGVRVQIYIKGGYSGEVEKYFFFKFGTAPAFTNYL